MGKSSFYRGVTLFRPTGKWRAQISAGGKTTSLGDHDTEVEAAKAFDRAAINKSGFEARTNFDIQDYADEVEALQGMSQGELVALLRARARKSGAQTSHFRGVSLLKQTGKWHAQINVGGKQVHLGFFNSEEAAARAYDRAAINKGARDGGKTITNFALGDYLEELALLRRLPQDDLVQALASDSRRKQTMELLAEGFGGRAEQVFGPVLTSGGGGGDGPTVDDGPSPVQIAELLLRAERAAPKPTEKNPLYPPLAPAPRVRGPALPAATAATAAADKVTPPPTPSGGRRGAPRPEGWAGPEEPVAGAAQRARRLPGRTESPPRSEGLPAVPTPSASPAQPPRRRAGALRELSPEREAALPGVLPGLGLGVGTGPAPLSPTPGGRQRRAPRRLADAASPRALRHLSFDDEVSGTTSTLGGKPGAEPPSPDAELRFLQVARLRTKRQHALAEGQQRRPGGAQPAAAGPIGERFTALQQEDAGLLCVMAAAETLAATPGPGASSKEPRAAAAPPAKRAAVQPEEAGPAKQRLANRRARMQPVRAL